MPWDSMILLPGMKSNCKQSKGLEAIYDGNEFVSILCPRFLMTLCQGSSRAGELSVVSRACIASVAFSDNPGGLSTHLPLSCCYAPTALSSAAAAGSVEPGSAHHLWQSSIEVSCAMHSMHTASLISNTWNQRLQNSPELARSWEYDPSLSQSPQC